MSASFLYPARGNFTAINDGSPINARDVLYIEYQSTFHKLNLSLHCNNPLVNPRYSVASANNLPPNGTYRFGSVQDARWDHNVTKMVYPTMCHIELAGDHHARSPTINGEDFRVVSDLTSSLATFSPRAPDPTSTSTTPSATGRAASEPINTDSSGSSGLSAGAKAAVGVGTSIAILLLVGLMILILRRRAPPEMTGDKCRPASKKRAELGATNLGELSTDEPHQIHEIGT